MQNKKNCEMRATKWIVCVYYKYYSAHDNSFGY